MPTAQLSSEDPALPQGPSSPWFLQAAVVAAWSMGRKTHKHQSTDQKWPQEALPRLACSPAEPGADHAHCGPALSIRHTETFLTKGALPPVLGGLWFGRPQWDHTLPGHQAVVKAVDTAEVVLVRDDPSSGYSQPSTPKHVQGVCGPRGASTRNPPTAPTQDTPG